jgi:hypothetical protein
MKRFIQVVAVAIALSIGGALFFAANISAQAQPAPQVNEHTREAMTVLLNDERRSEAQYAAVIEKFGEVRPFVNIIRAERRHQAMLLELFKKYNVAVPANALPEETAPATLRAACEAGVRSEKENIALYDKFLQDVKEPDIRRVFTALRDASRLNHLPAFERCAAGRGQGRGQGRR